MVKTGRHEQAARRQKMPLRRFELPAIIIIITIVSMKISNSRFLSIVMQVLAWLAFAFSFLLYTPSEIFGVPEVWEKQLLFTGMLVMGYYFNSEFLIPRLLLKAFAL